MMLRLPHIIFISSFLLNLQLTFGQTNDTIEIFLLRIDTNYYYKDDGGCVVNGFIWEFQNLSDSVYVDLSQDIGCGDMGQGGINGTYELKTALPNVNYLIYSNNQLIQTASFKNYKKDGIWTGYYSLYNGSAKKIYHYKEDKLHLAKFINTSGNETDSLIYYFSIYTHSDSMIGYWSNGEVKNIFYYNENNKPYGKWKYWDRNGNLIKEEFYDNGKFIERKKY